MKLLSFLLTGAILLATVSIPSLARADGCYLCSGGGYVAYTGDDTFDKRKKAQEQFGCQVSGTTSSCSNPKGTVSSLGSKRSKLVACNQQ